MAERLDGGAEGEGNLRDGLHETREFVGAATSDPAAGELLDRADQRGRSLPWDLRALGRFGEHLQGAVM